MPSFLRTGENACVIDVCIFLCTIYPALRTFRHSLLMRFQFYKIGDSNDFKYLSNETEREELTADYICDGCKSTKRQKVVTKMLTCSYD